MFCSDKISQYDFCKNKRLFSIDKQYYILNSSTKPTIAYSLVTLWGIFYLGVFTLSFLQME